MMIKPPRGVQNGCGGGGGGGGGGVKTGGGTSANTKLPLVVPPNGTLPWPIGTMYQVWQTPMSHPMPRYGTPCPGHQECGWGENVSACATPVDRPAPVIAMLPASSVPAIAFFMAASFRFFPAKVSRD